MAWGCCIYTLVAMSALVTLNAADAPYKVIFHLENLERGGVGNVVVEVHPEWAPLGAQRFAELLEQRFFDNNRFFRVVCGFVAQFGISGDAKVSSAWRGKTILDDPQKFHVANNRGRLSFFTDGKDDRSTQIVFNVKDNDFLDEKGYVPFAEVVEGMFFIDRVYNKYGGAARAPEQSKLEAEGNTYVDKEFPLLTHIKSVEILDPNDSRISRVTSMGSSAFSPAMVGLGVFLVVGIIGGGWFFHVGSQSAKAGSIEP